MPAQAETQKLPTRRTRRLPKKSATTNTLKLNGSPQIPDHGETDATTTHPNTSPTASEIVSSSARSQRSTRSKKEMPNEPNSAPDNSKSRKSKGKVSHPKQIKKHSTQTPKQIAPAVSGPLSNTLEPATRTPSKAYAGPTFHKSPAASSLPIPTFLSKSVPNVNKTVSLKNMLDHDSLGSTSESDGSPLQDVATPSKSRHVREVSPLDIFFRADEEAKARNSHPNDENMDIHKKSHLPNDPRSALGSQLKPRPMRNHIRHHTDSSSAGVFPLEMEGRPAQMANNLNLYESTRKENPSFPSSPALTEEQRQAQTLALKKLLNLPVHEEPNPSKTEVVSSSANIGSPSLKPQSACRSSPRLSGKLPEFPNGLDSPTPDQRRAALLALAEKQITMSKNQTNQRALPSSLRKEVSLPKSPDSLQTPDFPFTPTSSRTQSRQKDPATRQLSSMSNGYNLRNSTPVANSATLPRNNPISSSNMNLKLMEDDLRRILKLN